MKPFHMDNYQVICVIFIYFHIKKLDLCSIFHRLNPSCGKSFVNCFEMSLGIKTSLVCTDTWNVAVVYFGI